VAIREKRVVVELTIDDDVEARLVIGIMELALYDGLG